MKKFSLQLLIMLLFSITVSKAQTQTICSGSPFSTTINVQTCNCIGLQTNGEWEFVGIEYDNLQVLGADLAPGTTLNKVQNGNVITVTGRVVSSTCGEFKILIYEYCKYRNTTNTNETMKIYCNTFWSQPIRIMPNITQNNIGISGANSVLNCTRSLLYSVDIPSCYYQPYSDLNCEWTIPADWTGTSGGTNNQAINVTTSECTGGTISVHITATTPCPINITKQMTVTRTPQTEGDVEIYGDRCLCNVTGGSFNLPESVCGTITWAGDLKSGRLPLLLMVNHAL